MVETEDKFLNSYDELLLNCGKLIETVNEFQLPGVKPRWFDNSDAGPGIGVTNFEVRFRDAGLTLLYRRDYGCRVHSARGCFGDNEAERTNSAVDDGIIDGATLQWERYPRFHNLTDDEIANLTIKEFDAHEEERMEMNAWWVAKELPNRIDGAPVFNEYIHSLSLKNQVMHFSSTEST